MLIASSMGTDTFRCSQLAAGRHRWGGGGKMASAKRRRQQQEQQASGKTELQARRP
jgi:hypothetical protein